MSDYLSSIGLDTADFEKAVARVIASEKKIDTQAKATNKTLQDQEKQAKKTSTAWSGFSKVLGALGVSISASAVIGAVKGLVNYGEAATATSKELGLTTEEVTRFQRSLSQSASTEDATAALREMNAAQKQVAEGNDEVRQKLATAGVTDFANADKSVLQLADSYSKAEDKAVALQNISAILGQDLASRLTPEFEKGGRAIEDYGNNISVATAKATENLNSFGKKVGQAWDFLKQASVQGLGDPFGTAMSLATGQKPSPTVGAKAPANAAKVGDEQRDLLNDLTGEQQQLRGAEIQRTATLQSQLHILQAQMHALEAQASLAQSRGQTAEVETIAGKYAEIKLQLEQINFEYEQGLNAAAAQERVLELQITGNEHLAIAEEQRAKYAGLIAAAERAGNQQLAIRLRGMQKLETLQERIRQNELGPQGRREEAAANRRANREARKAASQLRDAGPHESGLSSGGLTSGGLTTSGVDERHNRTRSGDRERKLETLNVSTLKVDSFSITGNP